jgi:hypothetical protein
MPFQIGSTITLENVIVCEDVRPEKGGKWSILGAFSGDIVVASLPGNLRLAFYADGETISEAKKAILVRLSLNGTEILKLQGQFDAKRGPINFPFPGTFINVAAPGSLEIALSEDGNEWVTIITKKIIVGQIPA